MALAALEGFTVGVTADRKWEQQADLLRRRGANVVHGPAMATRYAGESPELQQATDRVAAGVDCTVVTTGVGVRAWFDAAEAHDRADELRSAIGASSILCRGPKAAAALRAAGVEPAPAAQSETLAELLAPPVLTTLSGLRVAFQHHGTADASWLRRLAEAGAEVVAVPVYRWEMPGSDARALRLIRSVCSGRIDAVTFTSAPAVANLMRIADRHALRPALLDAFNRHGVVAACVGPVCAAGAREQGLESPLAPEVGRLGLLVRLVTDVLGGRRRCWTWAGFEAVLQGRALVVGDDVFRLSEAEARLIGVLAERPGSLTAKGPLADRVGATPGAVEATVGRLRRRLGPGCADVVQTVRGGGYRLRCP